MMPDYEYMLWTDASSREFIAKEYPWFLHTFDGYTYPIERADAIRYFVLYYYGGIYLDLDIGCLRPLDPLLVYPVILPKTIPVGVSNDLMFSERGHPFLAQAIHNLVTFDHNWVLNYPTVMFSTGPMFLSAQYGIYVSSHPAIPGNGVRILPKALYGKNAKEGEAPHSFFSHFYGSSWHADDAAVFWFLANWGKKLMWVGLAILVIGLIRLAWPNNKHSLRRIGGYDVVLPRWNQVNGRWHLDLGWFTLPASGISAQYPSPNDGVALSPTDDEDVTLLHLPFDVRSQSPDNYPRAGASPMQPLFDAVRRVRNRAAASIAGPREEPPRTPVRSRRHRGSRGVMFFLPAIFTQSQGIELRSHRHSASQNPPLHSTSFLRASQLPPEKQRYASDLERADALQPEYLAEMHNERGLESTFLSSHTHLIDLSNAPRPSNSRNT
jgi:hypothetical protein